MPASADTAAAVAVRTASPPLQAPSPYHAFATCPPTALFAKPKLWPGPQSEVTTARLLWDEAALYICFECEGQTAAPVAPERVEPGVLAGLEGGAVPAAQRSVLLDERVEAFIWPTGDQSTTPAADQHYFAFEVNYGGLALTNKAQFGGRMDFSWGGESAYSASCFEIAVGWGASSSPVPSAVGGMGPPLKTCMILTLPWAPMGIDPLAGSELRIGLHRAQHSNSPLGDATTTLGAADVDALLSGMRWSSWIEPTDAPEEVNFHRPGFFAPLTLAPLPVEGADEWDCACCAVRLVKPNQLFVLPSPKPSIDECPPGSILVRAKYASVCGSDMPYFKKKDGFMAPSSYQLWLSEPVPERQRCDWMQIPIRFWIGLHDAHDLKISRLLTVNHVHIQ